MSAPRESCAWPERDETLGATTLTIQRGWREDESCRHASGPWTYFEVQRPPHERWDVLYISQMDLPEPVDTAWAGAAVEEMQQLVDSWAGVYPGDVDECTPIARTELGGEIAWRWTVRGRYEKEPFVGSCYLVITPERLIWLRGLGPVSAVEDLDPAIGLMIGSFRVADEPNDLAREAVARREAKAEVGAALAAPPDTPEALRPVLEAWRLASGSHESIGAPADGGAIAAAEKALGKTLPVSMRVVYEVGDGLALLGGNLNLLALDEMVEEAAGTDAEAMAGPPLPSELLLFGNDGSEQRFALWLPDRRGGNDAAPVSDPPVIALDVETGGMAIAGTSLVAFLRGRTAYSLILLETGEEALDALDVPGRLRDGEPDDDLFVELTRWADPDLEHPRADPTDDAVDADELRTRFGS